MQIIEFIIKLGNHILHIHILFILVKSLHHSSFDLTLVQFTRKLTHELVLFYYLIELSILVHGKQLDITVIDLL